MRLEKSAGAWSWRTPTHGQRGPDEEEKEERFDQICAVQRVLWKGRGWRQEASQKVAEQFRLQMVRV